MGNLRWCGVVLLCLLVGCYEHHRREEASIDAASDTGPPDATTDAGPDASTDAGPDASDASDSRDAEPTVDAPCSARVPDDYPTLQDAIDLTLCDPIVVTQDQHVGAVTVARSLTITTPGLGTQRVISGDGNGSVFTIVEGVSVTLERLTIEGGVAPMGGGIHSEGTLTLRDVTLRNNLATPNPATPSNAFAQIGGGGLFQGTSPLRLHGEVVFENNRAVASDSGAAAGGAMILSGEVTYQGHLWLRGNSVVAGRWGYGGAVVINSGSLIGDHLTVEHNSVTAGSSSAQDTTGFGGAITMFGGTLRASQFEFHDNSVRLAASETSLQALARGGGIACFFPGTLELSNGSATSNTAIVTSTRPDVEVGAGGGFLFGSCDVSFEGVTLENNAVYAEAGSGSVAQANGGAIDSQGNLSIAASLLRSNTSTVTVRGDPVGTPGPLFGLHSWARGGAVRSLDGTLLISDSWITLNGAYINALNERGALDGVGGGAIAIERQSNQNVQDPRGHRIERTAIVNNQAGVGAQSAVNGQRSIGGALLVRARSVLSFAVAIASSTLANNRALSSTGDIVGVARGGAIGIENDADPPVELTLVNATITGNVAIAGNASGAAIATSSSTQPVSVSLSHSILWNNSTGAATECSEAMLTGTHNIASDLTCFATPDTSNVATDPLLQPITRFGPLCEAVPIDVISPAHDSGDRPCPAPNGVDNTRDQCGNLRLGACDLGAFEAGETRPTAP